MAEELTPEERKKVGLESLTKLFTQVQLITDAVNNLSCAMHDAHKSIKDLNEKIGKLEKNQADPRGLAKKLK